MTTEAHPPLAELAERIAKGIKARFAYQGDYAEPMEAADADAAAQETITAHLAPLYAEMERLKADVARKDALLFEVQQQVGNQCEDVKRHALTPGLRDRIDAEIGATP